MINQETITLIILILNLLMFVVINGQIIRHNFSTSETNILAEINQARRRYGDTLLVYTQLRAKEDFLNEQESKEFELYQRVQTKAEEELLNTYDTFCGMYLDKKIDKKRFKKSYRDNIINLIESNDLESHFTDKKAFKNLLKVYYEWT